MRASFERAELARLLGPTNRVVEARNTIPILSNLVLAVETGDAPGLGGSVSVKATDLDILITATGAAQVDEAGAVAVNAKRLDEIVKKFPPGATIAVETDGNFLVVRSGRSRFKLPTLPVEDFPDISAGEFEAEFTVDLAALLKPVAFAQSSESTRYYLCGTYLHALDVDGVATLRAVATDGHRLAQHDIAAPAGAAALRGVIVPSKTVGLVPAGAIDVSMSATKIRFASVDFVLTSKVIDGTFPDYQRVIPRDNREIVRADRDALMAAVDRVAVMSSHRGVKLVIADTSLSLSARSDDGDATDEIEVDYSQEPTEIGFNSGYLRDVLAAFTGDKVEIRLAGPQSPGYFTDGGMLTCVLMGMRV